MNARWARMHPWDFAGVPETAHLPCWRTWIVAARGATAQAQSEINKREARRTRSRH